MGKNLVKQASREVQEDVIDLSTRESGKLESIATLYLTGFGSKRPLPCISQPIPVHILVCLLSFPLYPSSPPYNVQPTTTHHSPIFPLYSPLENYFSPPISAWNSPTLPTTLMCTIPADERTEEVTTNGKSVKYCVKENFFLIEIMNLL